MKSDDSKKTAIHQPLTEDSFSKPKIILSREKSLELWLKGKDEWNSWMKDNPDNSVDFRGVHFNQSGIEKLVPSSKYDFAGKYQRSLETISFEEYIFNGNTDFAGAKFPSPTFFNGAIFKEAACFNGVIFEKEANFLNATFKSFAIFTDAHFKGSVSFGNAIFKSTTNFISTTFNLMAYFPSSIFEDAVTFSHANFDGSTHFLGATFNCTVIDFEEIKSSDTFYFENAITHQAVTLSFKGSSFEKDFIIDGNFNCIPDLRGTKLNHHTELSSLNYKLKRVWVNPFTPIRKAAFKADTEKLCRLKELAEQNKNHDKALAFHADEMRAKRWTKLNTAQSILDLLYSATSNYGQSIMRPLLCLFLSFILFSSYLVSKSELEMGEALSPAATTSIATMTPFISVSKDARQFGTGQLFKTNIPTNFYLWSYAHASASFVFIFLIGLGLRNRFRI